MSNGDRFRDVNYPVGALGHEATAGTDTEALGTQAIALLGLYLWLPEGIGVTEFHPYESGRPKYPTYAEGLDHHVWVPEGATAGVVLEDETSILAKNFRKGKQGEVGGVAVATYRWANDTVYFRRTDLWNGKELRMEDRRSTSPSWEQDVKPENIVVPAPQESVPIHQSRRNRSYAWADMEPGEWISVNKIPLD